MRDDDPWQDLPRLSVVMRCEHKWSLWSEDRSVWESAPDLADALRAMESLGGDLELVTLYLSSRKEIRYGHLRIEGEAEEPEADAAGVRLPGALHAIGVFSEEWDEMHALADTLNLTEEEVESIVPRTHDGENGVSVMVDVRAATVDELLRLIDERESDLIDLSSRAWADTIDAAKKIFDARPQ
jgi:hypothetical protein